MPGDHQSQLILRANVSRKPYLQGWVLQHYGCAFDIVLLFCTSTGRQDPTYFEVWVIPEQLAMMGGTAYVLYGTLVQALWDFYSAAHSVITPHIMDYPEHYIHYENIFGKAYAFANYEGHVDYYVQLFSHFDSVIYFLFRIDVEHPDQWYNGTRVYVGPRSMPEWERPPIRNASRL